MPSNEQRREAAKRKLERQLVRRAQRARRRRVIGISVTLVVVLALGGGIWWLATLPPSSANAENSPSTTSAPPAKTSGGPCKYTETPDAPAVKEAGGLPQDPNPTPKTGTVALDLKTSAGDIPVTLDRAKAGCTVQSIEHLVKAKYYDNSPCHRETSGQLNVLQCGDPKGTGSGGPGYTIPDEKPTDLKPTTAEGAPAGTKLVTYPRGTIAMAKTQAPNSGGSQFFLVYKDSTLTPDYTVFGTVSEAGLATLDKIAGEGINPAPQNGQGDGAPKTPVTITQATIA
ncbi:hypothetical protein GCM10010174_04630 [Kutzneria viridogrisea]|uniref:PPIase cyclophilin-type domain-containing protein n=2 Tax=Kutzneria TaxID=43356 RepID=W5WP50_9PSEU|nr:peptidylprolyl isomerase [Kutzneria albida]AHH99954.1 hypothetical protein KALB_6595 [Kutzneria albida DSM 43870]MBA8925135.1 peptidyl-prolyl cis-trans isomerase B (cyclophilin B) [Kutzneria viridogrisea]